ncbi:phospholipase C, phosphocholine-specific [Sphingobacterium sp. SGG-5]|uniref:phosphocholine-specific phospholipase C n=1 Tax=Sphingobacterium sp. SGG-5 TaxID=2710881 RepID=UPI0013EBDC58|nr:phospholipase C, phosphocholine-specific [Sphingobacterium sp. SGG-5]NGM63202.1 phospholipase C, phosphocholine-specific [Sphingobacterium sp. SGG-5]
MDTRREFIKKSIYISGLAGLSSVLPPSIQRALAIDPAPGSTFLDAEHVVLLMQENRSFDHCYGTLQGVRGFNDPRAVRLPDGNPVWLQKNAAGLTYPPFRLNINDTRITWMGSLPHSRESQVDAFNEGKYDKWLFAKRPSNKKYRDMPLTMGYYDREDLPFNYALADAFTICDQNFCSANSSTHPNRHYFWTGTIRDPKDPQSRALIRNQEAKEVYKNWKTFPERLEENNISWKVYQNDVRAGGGFKGEERDWLSNYNCNSLEYFDQYHVNFTERNIKSLKKLADDLPKAISKLEAQLASSEEGSAEYVKHQKALKKKQSVLSNTRKELETYSEANFDKLSQKEKNLHQKAFTINKGDPDYHSLETIAYLDGNNEHEITLPKGDILYQFRKDVTEDKLPTVSWLVPPHYFIDHPSVPMYGPWYFSEVLDILTKNPEVWKKTIFIITYDENDGYFDHVPPFMPYDITKPNSGKCSEGINVEDEYISLSQEKKYLKTGGKLDPDADPNEVFDGGKPRPAPIGLGYRVPLLIASPWSRGGKVCSEVFDHTSSLQFLETFLNKKFGLQIKEENISPWRRTVCGDLTSSFTPYNPQADNLPFLDREAFMKKIQNARFKGEPTGYKALSEEEIQQARKEWSMGIAPLQEKGVKASCALPYELYAEMDLASDKTAVDLTFEARNKVFGQQAAGSPFTVYAWGLQKGESPENRQYAVAAGKSVQDQWAIEDFTDRKYHLEIYGPNGFYRAHKGNASNPDVSINCAYETTGQNGKAPTGNIALKLANRNAAQAYTVEIVDNAYKSGSQKKVLDKGASANIVLDLNKSHGWYDFTVRIVGNDVFEKRYAGRVETGKEGFSDPLMGGVI